MLAMIGLSGVVRAQADGLGPVVTDRPDFTKSAETVPGVALIGSVTLPAGADAYRENARQPEWSDLHDIKAA